MTKRYMKSCSKSLLVRRMQIKPAMISYITPVRMSVITKTC